MEKKTLKFSLYIKMSHFVVYLQEDIGKLIIFDKKLLKVVIIFYLLFF